MAINPNEITTVRVDQLASASLDLAKLIPIAEVNGELKQSTIQALSDFIANVIGATGGVGFLPISVTDGQQLPNVPENPSFFLAGKGTYLNINGFPNIVCTDELNAIMSLSDHWELAVGIPIVAEVGVQTVTGSAVDNTDPLNPVINSTGGSSTLQEVTNNGNTTTNAITVQGVTISGSTENINVTNVGDAAGFNNTGGTVTNIGASAGFNNTGDDVINLGVGAGHDNSGNAVTNLGKDAGYNNSGNDVTNLGKDAGKNNSGTNVSNLGRNAGNNNTLDNVINIGKNSQATATNQLALNTSIANTVINLPATATELTLRDSASVESIAYLSDISASSGVPYTGATANVNLGEFGITAGQVTLDTTPTGTPTVATTRWNDSLGSSETTLKGGSVVLKNGVDLVARVVNKVTPNTTLTKANYQVVKVSGAQGQRLAVNLAQANNDNNSADTLGIVTETIATNQEGFIITVGQLEGINTTGSLQSETWADGDVLYLSPTVAGRITNVKPNGATGHIVIIGYVEYSHSVNGKIYVKIMNGWELDELHNVAISTPLNNQGLIYETSTQLWKNKTIIEDSITNGVTTIAPSQNAVFDALALKQDTLTDSNFGTFVNTLTAKNTLIDADEVVSDDSADSNKAKKTSWLNVWNNFIKTKTDALYATIASVALKLDIASPSFTGLMNGTGTTQTGSSANGVLNLSQTWNTTGAVTAIRLNVANTASAGNSLLMDLQLGGTSQFRVNRFGDTNATGIITANLGFISGRAGTASGSAFSWTSTNNTLSSGVFNTFVTAVPINPTSGTGEFNIFNASPIINQTGGANGIIRGLYVAPTLTSAADFRAIEVTNGSVVLPYATASATYPVKTSDYLLNFTTGTFTATLPTAVGCTGKHYIFKNTGTGIITIATTSSQTIDGVTTYTLSASLNKYVHVVSTGANWIVIANN